MVMGEHGALAGKRAMVCAVDQRINVTLTPRNDHQVAIYSPRYGSYVSDLQHLRVEMPYPIVLSALLERSSRLPAGCNLGIASDLPAQIGLGSSSALAVGIVAVLEYWLAKATPESATLWAKSRQLIQGFQKVASGADVAASIYGGLLLYQNEPLQVQALRPFPPLTMIYSGSKKSTEAVVRIVDGIRNHHPRIFETIFQAMDEVVCAAVPLLAVQDWEKLVKVMVAHSQGLQ